MDEYIWIEIWMVYSHHTLEGFKSFCNKNIKTVFVLEYPERLNEGGNEWKGWGERGRDRV